MCVEAVKPSEMFLAYKHTNMCAHLLRKRTDEMGLEETLISIDDYVDGLVCHVMSFAISITRLII